MSTPREPTSCLYYLVSRVTLVATRALRSALEQAGLGEVRPAYLGVLLCLWEEDRTRVVDLGRRAGLEPSTMTGLLDRMARDGLIGREPDPDDRRAWLITLSPHARTLGPRVLEVVGATLARLTTGLPGERLEEVKQALRQVLDNARDAEAG